MAHCKCGKEVFFSKMSNGAVIPVEIPRKIITVELDETNTIVATRERVQHSRDLSFTTVVSVPHHCMIGYGDREPQRMEKDLMDNKSRAAGGV